MGKEGFVSPLTRHKLVEKGRAWTRHIAMESYHEPNVKVITERSGPTAGGESPLGFTHFPARTESPRALRSRGSGLVFLRREVLLKLIPGDGKSFKRERNREQGQHREG